MQPTTGELKQAFKRTGLRQQGWSFSEALANKALQIALTDTALATSKKQQAAGTPAPKQLELI